MVYRTQVFVDEEYWPKQLKHPATTDELKARSVSSILYHQVVKVDRFSNWQRLRRTQAYVNRFIYNMIAKVRKLPQLVGILTRNEYQRAEQILFKQAQASTFLEEYICLLEERDFPTKSPIKKYLPYVDDEGVMRCKSRIDAAESALNSTKRPILLPGQHYIGKLILKHYHELYLHIHHKTAITCILQKFEIPKLRVEMGKVRSQCQQCKNLKARPRVPVMANLPSARLSTFTRPFSFIGIDYFGPLKVVSGREQLKR